MRIALAADHAGAELKDELMGRLAPLGHELIDRARLPEVAVRKIGGCYRRALTLAALTLATLGTGGRS